MKVMVTGGCGFIGSHVCEYFRNKGWDVIAYDNLTKHELVRTGYDAAAARDYNLSLLKKMDVEVAVKDIRDYETLLGKARGCDYIVHTAAQPAVTISMEDPLLDITTNVNGTFNVLMAARELQVPVVSCATIHVYGNDINKTVREGKSRYERDPAEIDESEPTVMGILSPLHASKRAGDLYVQTFGDTYGVKAASFRLTGLYGPRQFGGEDHGWVAHFCIRALTGKPITIFGTGKQIRDILFATDLAECFYKYFEKPVPGIYNIGGGMPNGLSLVECVDLVAELTGRRPEVKLEPGRHADLLYFICDSARAKKAFGWQARTRPRAGVGALIEWIRKEIRIFK
ncbi:MAG: NAD-dependent epimerase/dehydratase family protein [Kiritimatiellae bacterium]|nr:NAD-dependent epimerase/dehydratase family protein [Kiritimatiellia bacterium]